MGGPETPNFDSSGPSSPGGMMGMPGGPYSVSCGSFRASNLDSLTLFFASREDQRHIALRLRPRNSSKTSRLAALSTPYRSAPRRGG